MLASKKFIISISILVAVLIIGLAIIFFVFSVADNGDKSIMETIKEVTRTNDKNKNVNSIISVQPTNQNDTTQVNLTEKTEKEDQDDLMKLARNFTQRYGTYSNQNDFANLKSIQDYMTQEMSEKVTQMMVDSKNSNEPFYSFTTQATTVDLAQYNKEENQAVVWVHTMRTEESDAAGSKKSYQQKIELHFILDNGKWKVNQAIWHN